MPEYFYNCFELTQLDYQNSAVLSEQYFIDDSELNVKEAKRLGVGHVIHYVELSSDVENLKQNQISKSFMAQGTT